MKNRLMAYLNEFTNKTIDRLANILIPKEKRVKQLENLGPAGLFENIPRAENFDLRSATGRETDKLKAIFSYRNTLCRQAIWEIKYRANTKLIADFSLLLYEYILDDLADLDTFANFKKPVLLPIPSARARKKQKGFNQCQLIAREVMRLDEERKGNNFTLCENFLVKKMDTPHQARVNNRKNRLENLKGSFSVNGSDCLDTRNNSFIIIDDVITTGATMNEAFRALKTVGINSKNIRGYALAH